MSAYFVTATGTDIGKTYVAAGLLTAWRESGLSVAATKPVMSGFSEHELDQSDAGRLLDAMGQAVTPETVSEICLHRLTPPLAPNVAMRQAGIVQDYGAIRDFVSARLNLSADRHLVEGAGGIMSPLTDDSLQIDLASDLGLPIILVTAAYLGSVSHTLSAIDVLTRRGLSVAALVVSQAEAGSADPAIFLEEVGRFASFPGFILKYGEKPGMLAKSL